MSLLSYLIWSPDPAIFNLPLSIIGGEDRPVVWYGLLFALGFIISQQVLYFVFRQDGQDERDVDTLTTYMVLATIVGARLGHCLFYNPKYYLSNPIEILKVWEGGLASHGGAIGIFIALWIYANYEIKVKWWTILPIQFSAKKQKKKGQSYLWVLDRIAIVTLLTGALIRTGNLMNSEMEGLETGSDYGLIYARGTKEVLNYDPGRIEEISFEKGGNLSTDEPGKAPITAIVHYKRGEELSPVDQSYINSRLKSRLTNYSEVTQHVNFGPTDQPLNYEIEKTGGRTSVKIYAIGTIRHPAQLYEATACLIFMIITFLIWRYKREEVNEGFIFGVFMALLWSQRFFNEFFKMDQEPWEASIPLNMGQWLSIPMFIAGVAVIIYTLQKPKSVSN